MGGSGLVVGRDFGIRDRDEGIGGGHEGGVGLGRGKRRESIGFLIMPKMYTLLHVYEGVILLLLCLICIIKS